MVTQSTLAENQLVTDQISDAIAEKPVYGRAINIIGISINKTTCHEMFQLSKERKQDVEVEVLSSHIVCLILCLRMAQYRSVML